MSTREHDVAYLRSELARMEADPYKAPEQVEEVREALRKCEAGENDCTCGDADIPFCGVHFDFSDPEMYQ